MAPKVLLISLEKAPYFDEMYADLLVALREKSEVVEATSAAIAMDFFGLPTTIAAGIAAVLVTDPGLIHDAKFANVVSKVVEYAREGGSLIFGGHCSGDGEFPAFNKFFQGTLCVPWRFGSYTSDEFRLNEVANDRFKKKPPVPKTYNMKATHLFGPPLLSQLYIKSGISPRMSEESPVVFASYGRGHVGWMGDVNAEAPYKDVVLAMCGLL